MIDYTGRKYFPIHPNDAGRMAFTDQYVQHLEAEVARLRERLAAYGNRIGEPLAELYAALNERDEAKAEVARLRAENDALNSQLTNTGIVPYLDRMRELAEQRDEARDAARWLYKALDDCWTDEEALKRWPWLEDSTEPKSDRYDHPADAHQDELS